MKVVNKAFREAEKEMSSETGCGEKRIKDQPNSLHRKERTVTLYRDDSTVQVVFENVKTVFWTANNTVLVISRYIKADDSSHYYIHWPRERFCWFKDEPQG